MVFMSQTRVVSALLLLISSQSAYSASYCKWPTSLKEAGQTALIAGGGALGIYACYKGIEWLMTPTTQTVVDKAQEIYKQETELHIVHIDHFNSYQLRNKYMLEEKLESMLDYKRKYIGTSMEDYLKTLNKSITSLSDQYAKLALRLQKLHIDESFQFQPIIMQLMKDIDILITNYRNAHKCLFNHLHYFNLSECKNRLFYKYECGLNSINSDTNEISNPALKKHIDNTDFYNYYGRNYPYMNYLRSIQYDIERLAHLASKLSDFYFSSFNESQNLLSKLRILESAVESSHSYLREHNSYELEKLKHRQAMENFVLQQQLRDMEAKLAKKQFGY